MANSNVTPGPQAGAAQALALILAMTLPLAPLLALVSNLPQLFQHFAATPHRDFLVPLIITMPSVCIALLAPVAGTLADRFGRRRLMLFALGLFTVCGLLPLWLEDLQQILVAQIGVGIAEAIIMTTGATLFGDYFEPVARRRWLGVQSILGSVLASLILLAGGALGTLSWHAPFLLNALGGVVLVWMLVATWEPVPSAHDDHGVADARGFPWRRMSGIFAVTLVVSVLYFVQAVELGLIFSKLGAASPALISVITTVASFGVVCGGWWYRRQRNTSVSANLMRVFVAYGLGLVGLGLARDYWVGLPFGIVAQFGNGVVIPVLVGWALATLEFKYRGRGMGMWTTFFYAGQFQSPNLVALVSGMRHGDFLGAVALIGTACIGLAAIAWWQSRRAVATPALAN